MKVFTDFHEFGPCDVCQIIQCISSFFKDICTIACNNSTVIKRNTIMCVIYHGVGLFQFSEIIPVDIHIFEICKCIRIALQIFLIAVVLHQNDVRKCAVVTSVSCCCKFCLAVVRRCFNNVYCESFVIFCVLLTSHLHGFDVEVLVPCPYCQCVVISGISGNNGCCSCKRCSHDTCH